MRLYTIGKVLPAVALFVAACGAPTPSEVAVNNGDNKPVEATITLEDQTLTVEEDGQLTVTIDASVEPADAGKAEITVSTPGNGTLEGSGNSYTYKPNADFNGEESLTVTAKAGAKSVTATVKITVTPVNDAPSFTAGGDVNVEEDAGAQSLAWATEISAGPNETDTLTFVVDNDAPGLFSAQPSIDASGTLQFNPVANASGTATVSVSLSDGDLVTAVQTFTITVNAVNDAPTFVAGADVQVNEDSGAASIGSWASTIAAGPADESGQSVVFVVSNDNNALFSSQPTVSTTGTLSFSPAANAFGTANVSIKARDSQGAESSEHTLVITVQNVNDAPAFTKGGNVTVLEDAGNYSQSAWATGISAGAGESAQQVVFVISNTNNSLFATQPTVATDGTLSFRPADNTSGSATVSVRIRDNGGTANGGVNESASQIFTITVTAVNDAPSMVTGGTVTVLEDSGAYNSGWGSAFSAGANESQTLSSSISNNNPALFAVQPALTVPGGMLSFTPAANAHGTADISVKLWDNGTTANGGVTSATYTARIVVTSVNDAPTFTVSKTTVTVQEDDGNGSYYAAENALIVSPSVGPANEASQNYVYIIENSNPDLFSTAVTFSGTNLLVILMPNVSGTATLTIRMKDDGGTENGGVDLSTAATVDLVVAAVNDAPNALADSAGTLESHPVEIDVLANDSDVEDDTLTITAVGTAGKGAVSIINGGQAVRYEPTPGETGSDSFTYTVSDGDKTSQATVTVTIGADNVGPALVSGVSTPPEGDLLTFDEAFGSGGKLAPATFVFDDYNFDESAVEVVVNYKGVPLTYDAGSNTGAYTVDRSTSRTIKVSIDDTWLYGPFQAEGDDIQIVLSNIGDDFGNLGPDVTRNVVLDRIAPMAIWRDFHSGPSMRAILSLDESIAPESIAGFSFVVSDTSAPVAVEPVNGSGLFRLSKDNDTFYYIPRDLLERGESYIMDARGLTDLAGNPVAADGKRSITICCKSNLEVVRVEFVDRSDDSVDYVVAPAAIANGAFMLPATLEASNYDLRVVYSETLDDLWRAELYVSADIGGSNNFSGVLESVDGVDDAVRFAPADEDSAESTFAWTSDASYTFFVYANNAGNASEHQLDFALRHTGDIGPIVIRAVMGKGGYGITPHLQPGGSLQVVFNEPYDPTTLSADKFKIVSQGGTEYDVEIDTCDENDCVWVRPIANGRQVLLPYGAYDVVASNIGDRGTPGITTPQYSYAFEVTVPSVPAFVLDFLSPDDGASNVNSTSALTMYFSNPVSTGSLVDTGDPALRGFVLEELWGDTYLPLKGFTPQEGLSSRNVVRLRSDRGLMPNTTYRLTLTEGLRDVYGAKLAGGSQVFAPREFVTGDVNLLPPTVSDVRTELSLFGATATFFGEPDGDRANFSINFWDNDGEQYQYRVDNLALGKAVDSTSTGNWIDIDVTAQIDDFFQEGAYSDLIHSLSDGTNTVVELSRPYRLSAATLAAAQPIPEPPVGSENPGAYAFHGQILGPDADVISRVDVYILIVDSTVTPINIIGFVGRKTAELTRYPGELNYFGGLNQNEQLPALPNGQAYVMVAQLGVPQGYDTGEDYTDGISLQSPPFIPAYP